MVGKKCKNCRVQTGLVYRNIDEVESQWFFPRCKSEKNIVGFRHDKSFVHTGRLEVRVTLGKGYQGKEIAPH